MPKCHLECLDDRTDPHAWRRAAGGWWEWKSQKCSLESLFTAGQRMIARRHNFQRVYDLAERVHPAWDDSQMPSLDETRRQLLL